ncbi:MAG: B12-binding domain-containing radical SAM protein [Candidatus Omnitrophica bacterium]|nr:B12-binding domain-containing radical SAM protein [Candidatus Omnitrophota bacterium]
MSNKDITLINFIDGIDAHLSLPLGCLSLIASLSKNNFTVDFRDYQLFKPRKKHTLKDMASFFKNAADIIAISCFSYMLPYVIEIVQIIKKETPEKIIILGGIGPSLVAGKILDNFPCIDIIVIGDGTETLPELLKVIKHNKNYLSVKGIGFRLGPSVIFTPKRTHSHIMSDSFIEAYKNINLKSYKKIMILTGQGCPFRCSFCCIPEYFKQHEKRNLNIVKDEILYLSKQKNCPKILYLRDDTFLSDKSRLYDFLSFSGQMRFKRKIEFRCYGRINFMSEKIIKDLSRNNFGAIAYGIESGSNVILKKIKKRFTIEEATRILLLSKKYFKEVRTSFIYGFPFESKNDFLDTITYIAYLQSMKIKLQLYLLCPLPNTQIYNYYKKILRFSEAAIPDSSPLLINTKDMKGLIIKYPDIFSTYYHYKSPALKDKFKIIKRLSCPRAN